MYVYMYIYIYVHVYEFMCTQADEIFALGELQLAEGFRFDAMLSFHTACVYYR